MLYITVRTAWMIDKWRIAFRFREPKTGIEVPELCETGKLPSHITPHSSLSCPLTIYQYFFKLDYCDSQ